MNLLLFNLAVDADDPILGFTTNWLNRIAAAWDYVDVITMRTGRIDVADNVSVYSVGKEQGYSERRRALEFYRLLARLLGQRKYNACFAHMMPLFAVMGSPLLTVRGVPITLWYTHQSRTRTLELATRVSVRVVTAAEDSFPIRTDKLRVLGHGIDTEFFAPAANPSSEKPATQEIVQVARIMPIKHQETLIRALAGLNLDTARAVFVGDVPPDVDSTYKANLSALSERLGVQDRVIFAGSQSATNVRDYLRGASAAVNLSPVGLFDKAALESMAVGVPTFVCSPAFRPVLGDYAPTLLLPAPDDQNTLMVRLNKVLSMPDDQRETMGREIRARVVEMHSIDGLILRLNTVLKTGELPA